MRVGCGSAFRFRWAPPNSDALGMYSEGLSVIIPDTNGRPIHAKSPNRTQMIGEVVQAVCVFLTMVFACPGCCAYCLCGLRPRWAYRDKNEKKFGVTTKFVLSLHHQTENNTSHESQNHTGANRRNPNRPREGSQSRYKT